jgi:salicylate hydroxylase
MRVIVAGGGIGGLATALALRKLGIEAVVLERKDYSGEVGAGLGLYPNAMKALVYLGCDALIRERSIDSQETDFRIAENDERIVLRSSSKTAQLYGDKAYTAHRADLHQTLNQALPQDFVRLDTRVVGFDQNESNVVVRLENGDEIEGDLLVGADGLRSTIRAGLFGDEKAQYTGVAAWRCLIPGERLSERYRDRHTLWLGDNRHAMLYGVRQDLYCLNAFVPNDETLAESWNVMGDVADLPGLYPGACEALDAILRAVDSTLISPIYYRDPLDQWSVGRVTLLGDAAHPAPPSAGQGAAMALEDALAFAHALHRHGKDNIPAALADYEARRKPRTRRMLLSSRVMLRIHNQPDAEQRLARNSSIRGVAQIDPHNTSALGWLWEYDPVAMATAPEPPPIVGTAPNPLKRPEARRAFDLLRNALSLDDRSRQWVGEREGYDRFLAQHCPAPADATVHAVDCDGVPGLMVTPAAGSIKDVTVLHLHGGGYIMGSARGSVRLAAQLAESVRGETLTIDYRLAAENPFPAGLDDAVTAYRWLAKRTLPENIVISGEDAGAGLALSLAVALRDAGDAPPRALHLVSPFADLSVSGPNMAANALGEPMRTYDSLRSNAGAYIGGTNFKDPLVSPVFADLTGLPPILIEAAEGEALFDDATRIAEAAERAGVPVRIELTPDSVNAFIRFDFLPETDKALERFADFVAEPALLGRVPA